jgi:hypothetical protein
MPPDDDEVTDEDSEDEENLGMDPNHLGVGTLSQQVELSYPDADEELPDLTMVRNKQINMYKYTRIEIKELQSHLVHLERYIFQQFFSSRLMLMEILFPVCWTRPTLFLGPVIPVLQVWVSPLRN